MRAEISAPGAALDSVLARIILARSTRDREDRVAHAVRGLREREGVVHGHSAGAGVAALPGEPQVRDNSGGHRAGDSHRITQKTTPGELVR